MIPFGVQLSSSMFFTLPVVIAQSHAVFLAPFLFSPHSFLPPPAPVTSCPQTLKGIYLLANHPTIHQQSCQRNAKQVPCPRPAYSFKSTPRVCTCLDCTVSTRCESSTPELQSGRISVSCPYPGGRSSLLEYSPLLVLTQHLFLSCLSNPGPWL